VPELMLVVVPASINNNSVKEVKEFLNLPGK
jgi:hypothetical protein